jgi:pimeloyl-ACP methyl ester carboxylesterase
MRALEPHQIAFVTNPHDGVRTYFEVFGDPDAARTILFVPTWSLVHSRCWKMQVPYFARRGFRVVTFDGRGNGGSERPVEGYTSDHYTRDALAVLDAAGIDRAAVVTLSAGCRPAVQLAATAQERVTHLVLIAPAIRLDGGARLNLDTFLCEPPDREGWNKYNAVHWREEYADFVSWFSAQIFSEPHSTKPIDDFIGWAMETTPEVLVATTVASGMPQIAEYCSRVHCPALIIHADGDRIIPVENSLQIQEAIPDCELVVFEGAGHAPNVRDPIRTNLAIREFIDRQCCQVCAREAAYARG